jgi:hypothetical protein
MASSAGDTGPSPAGDRHWPGRRLVTVILGVALVIAVAGTALAVATADERPEPVVPEGTASGPGTPLPDGMAVLAGSVLLGPVVVEEVDGDGQPASWAAIVMVEADDPLAVWSGYVAEMVRRAPSSDVDPDVAPGCRPGEDGDQAADIHDPLCELTVGRLRAELASVPGDVTDRYLLTLTTVPPSVDDSDVGDEAPTRPDDPAPAPRPARARPDVGGPLAPETVASRSDNDRYVLLDGSELVAQYGAGSLTGGFAVLLRITSDADLGEVADAYVEQATQFDGEDEPPPEVVEYDDTTYTTRRPPGGAGGYSGTITVVDAPGDDYVLYTLTYD